MRTVLAVAWLMASALGVTVPEAGNVVRFPTRTPKRLPKDVRRKIDDAADQALRDAGYTITAAKKRCAEETCYLAALERADAKAGVNVVVGMEGSDYQVTVTLVDATGNVAATQERVCEICRHPEVVASVAELVTAAAVVLAPPEEPAEPELPGTGLLSVVSSPPGAAVLVDGEAVGETPWRGEVSPGEHMIRVEREGFGAEERVIEMGTGHREQEAFELRRRRGFTPQTEITIGWAALGVGVAALITGAVLIGIDENPIRSDCSGENVDENGVCKFRRNTLGGGVFLVALGVAGVGAAAALLIHGHKRRGTFKRGSSKARAALAPGGLRIDF